MITPAVSDYMSLLAVHAHLQSEGRDGTDEDCRVFDKLQTAWDRATEAEQQTIRNICDHMRADFDGTYPGSYPNGAAGKLAERVPNQDN